MEILGRVKRANFGNVSDLADELVQRYGSHENAIAAIKSGQVQFEKIEHLQALTDEVTHITSSRSGANILPVLPVATYGSGLVTCPRRPAP